MTQISVSPQYVLDARHVLNRLHDDVASAKTHEEALYEPDSPAAIDAAAFGDIEPFETLMGQATFSIEHSGEHLSALARMLEEPVIQMTIWTAARGVLESSAWACWLADSDLLPDERVRRSMSIRLEDQVELKKLANESISRAMELPLGRARAARVTSAEQLLAHSERQQASILASAEARGLEVRQLKSGPSIGKRLPLLTELVRTVFDAAPEYRMLSGIAHGAPTLILSTSYTSDAVKKIARKIAQPTPIALWIIRVVEWFAKSVWDISLYAGRDLRPYARAFEKAYSELGLPASLRFWRKNPELRLWYTRPEPLL